MIAFTPDEKKLIEYAKIAIINYNKMRHKKGGVDTLYSFLMSNSGKIYDGACFEPNIAHATVCAERHAITNLISKESYSAKIKTIVVADPVPRVQKKSTPPCGTCRHLIWEFGLPSTTIILIQYIRRKSDWIFPKIEKHFSKDLYPYPYEPVKGLWD